MSTIDFSKLTVAQLNAKLVMPTTSKEDKEAVKAELDKRLVTKQDEKADKQAKATAAADKAIAAVAAKATKTKEEKAAKKVEAKAAKDAKAAEESNSPEAKAKAEEKAAADKAKAEEKAKKDAEKAVAKAAKDAEKAVAKAAKDAEKAAKDAEAKAKRASSFRAVGLSVLYTDKVTDEIPTLEGECVGITLDKRVPMYLVKVKQADGHIVHRKLKNIAPNSADTAANEKAIASIAKYLGIEKVLVAVKKDLILATKIAELQAELNAIRELRANFESSAAAREFARANSTLDAQTGEPVKPFSFEEFLNPMKEEETVAVTTEAL